MKRAVVAVVPTYRPPAQVQDLVSGLARQGVPVLVVDDASPCTSDATLRQLARLSGVEVRRNRRNAGIARSLNQALAVAHAREAGWLLTVDQDSRLADGYLEGLRAEVNDERIGVIGAEVVADASGDLRYPRWTSGSHLLTHEVFQTGSLWSVAALQRIGGFDERLGMDAVDAAACLHLRQAGYLVCLAPGVSLQHRLGDAERIRLLGRWVVVSHHGPSRRASILRNRLRLAPAEFMESPVHASRTIRRVTVQSILAVAVEDERLSKLRAMTWALLHPSKT